VADPCRSDNPPPSRMLRPRKRPLPPPHQHTAEPQGTIPKTKGKAAPRPVLGGTKKSQKFPEPEGGPLRLLLLGSGGTLPSHRGQALEEGTGFQQIPWMRKTEKISEPEGGSLRLLLLGSEGTQAVSGWGKPRSGKKWETSRARQRCPERPDKGLVSSICLIRT
jgi:hypothetical protein